MAAELAYRRACVLRTIASIQNQFLQIYSSKERQCKLGYDSSSSCDSFQLGEMVKFLTKKGLLSLVPFQAVSPDDPDYLWPEAYTGEIDYLIGLLRQCPSYQIDKYHGHCGLRTKLLPALDYIKSCMDTGLGIRLTRSTTGPSFESWIPEESPTRKRSFWVGSADGEDVDVSGKAKVFNFVEAKPKMSLGAAGGAEKSSKALFLAEKWNWVTEAEGMPRPCKQKKSFERAYSVDLMASSVSRWPSMNTYSSLMLTTHRTLGTSLCSLRRAFQVRFPGTRKPRDCGFG